jgi:hypothetical protein
MMKALKVLCGFVPLMKSTPAKKGEIDRKFNTAENKQNPSEQSGTFSRRNHKLFEIFSGGKAERRALNKFLTFVLVSPTI